MKIDEIEAKIDKIEAKIELKKIEASSQVSLYYKRGIAPSLLRREFGGATGQAGALRGLDFDLRACLSPSTHSDRNGWTSSMSFSTANGSPESISGCA